MICPKCGREIPDGTVCPCSSGSPMLSSNPALNALKTIGSSPLFLVAAILYSFTVVISFVASMNADASLAVAYQMMEAMDVDPSLLYPYMNAASGSTVAGAIIGLIPTGLIAAGMWLHYATCRDVKNGGISTTGLTICKVLSIITLVLICIAAVFIVVGAVLMFVGAGMMTDEYGAITEAGAIAGAAGVLLVAGLIAVALGIVYYVSVIKTINRIKGTALSGVPDNRVSRFLTVMNYIMAVCTAITAMVSLFTSPLSGLGSLASAACMILISVCLDRYRKEMTMLMYPPVQPTYTPPCQTPPTPPVG